MNLGKYAEGTSTVMKTKLGLFALIGLIPLVVTARPADDTTIYVYHEKTLRDGKYGPIAAAQFSIGEQLARCNLGKLNASGKFGPDSAVAIRKLAACDGFTSHLDASSPARQGALTRELWTILLPDRPPPTVDDRAQTLVLTYEDTDYTQLEWNFCQNVPLWSPAHPALPCYTNDPRSYVTWGPRGATAGHGREVQWIVARVDQSHPQAIDQAFGTRASDVRRLLRLDETSTRAYLCAVFADIGEREAWTEAFAKFGALPVVRAAYRVQYSSLAGDGAKMRAFYALYRQIGVAPTEVDYGFFLDRATHASIPDNIGEAARLIHAKLDATHQALTPANVRHAISGLFPATNQTEDRLGRDVAYFIDDVGIAGLTPRELAAWKVRGRLRASDVGLSDERPAPPLETSASIESPSFSERMDPASTCPASVMNPKAPLRR